MLTVPFLALGMERWWGLWGIVAGLRGDRRLAWAILAGHFAGLGAENAPQKSFVKPPRFDGSFPNCFLLEGFNDWI